MGVTCTSRAAKDEELYKIEQSKLDPGAAQEEKNADMAIVFDTSLDGTGWSRGSSNACRHGVHACHRPGAAGNVLGRRRRCGGGVGESGRCLHAQPSAHHWRIESRESKVHCPQITLCSHIYKGRYGHAELPRGSRLGHGARPAAFPAELRASGPERTGASLHISERGSHV